MRYSEMRDEWRHQLLDDPEIYPLRVTFLGKTGILTMEQVSFMRKNGVDFNVDDDQLLEILEERRSYGAWNGEIDENVLSGLHRTSPQRSTLFSTAAVAGGFLGLLRLIRRIFR